jgi:hypothetical protein
MCYCLLRFGFLSRTTFRLSPSGSQVLGGQCAIAGRFTRIRWGTPSAVVPKMFPGTSQGLAHWSKLSLQKRLCHRSDLIGSGAGTGSAGNKPWEWTLRCNPIPGGRLEGEGRIGGTEVITRPDGPEWLFAGPGRGTGVCPRPGHSCSGHHYMQR